LRGVIATFGTGRGDVRAKQRQIIVLVADAAERLGGPQGLPAGEAERAEGVGIGEPRDDVGWQSGAQPEIAD
jgi:hypothetical protein